MRKIGSIYFMALILILGESISHACADWYSIYDKSGEMFIQNQTGNKNLQPFYYTDMMRYYLPYEEEKNTVRDPLIEEWVSYGQNAFSYKDAIAIVQSGSYDTLSSIYYYLERNKPLALNTTWKGNSMVKWMLGSKDLEAIGYLMYATKVSEALMGSNGWQSKQLDDATADRLLKGAGQLYDAAKTSFGRERYKMLQARLLFQANRGSHSLSFADSIEGKQWKATAIHTLGYKAGALYRENQYDKAALLYARMFAAANTIPFSTVVSFEWCFGSHNDDASNSANLPSVLALCKTEQERAAVYVMMGLTNYGTDIANISNAYAAYPAINGLDLLISREISKLENNYYSLIYINNDPFYRYEYNRTDNTTGTDTLWPKAQQETAELLSVCASMADDKRVQNPAFYQSAMAYLSYLQEDYKKASAYCDAAMRAKPNIEIRQMVALQRLLLQLANSKQIDGSLESQMLPKLEEMEKLITKNPMLVNAYRNFLLQKLAPSYIQQGDTLKALVVNAKANLINGYNHDGPSTSVEDYSAIDMLSIPQLYSLQAYLSQPKQQPFDNWLRTSPSLDSESIPLFIVRKYVAQHKFADAVAALQKMKQPDTTVSIIDPFIARIKDTQEPQGEVQRMPYTQFLQKMAALQLKVSKKANDTELFEYATGLYNISYYGLNWDAGTYYRSGADYNAYSTVSRKNTFEQNQYYGVIDAMKYYKAALNASDNPNFKAKCNYMLAKCYQKSCPTISNYYYSTEDKIAYREYTQNSPYYKELQQNYSNTAFVKAVSTQCSYLGQYLRNK